MKPIPKLMSKSKLLRGYRCLKSIYLTIHHPEFEAPITPETQALFDQGNQVGAEARKHYPGGVLIDNAPWDFSGALANTKEHIAACTPRIYEAAFSYQGCYARADILEFNPETQRWRVYEVKSTTKVKPEHIDDAGLQAWIMAHSGLPLEQINIVHLNPECRYPDLSNLFLTQDITAEIRAKYLQIKPQLLKIFDTLNQSEIPALDIGPYCLAPSECGFKAHCWQEKKIPDLSILNLPGLRDRKWELYQSGIIQLDDERLNDLSPIQERIINAFKTGQRFIAREAITEALAAWQFPLIFLDFETINPAIPCYPGCGPYHHVPFQFSVHVLPNREADFIHHEFLHTEITDPRPQLIPALLNACGTEGTIVAYFSQFEAGRIEELAHFDPTHAPALQQLLTRLVDPLPILRDAVYDNAFHGSFSLKSVAPALLGESSSYQSMLIANGNDAQRAYNEIISPQTAPAKKQTLKKALLEYCQKDTQVMAELVQWLYAQNEVI